jgi:hypothetical protein
MFLNFNKNIFIFQNSCQKILSLSLRNKTGFELKLFLNTFFESNYENHKNFSNA